MSAPESEELDFLNTDIKFATYYKKINHKFRNYCTIGTIPGAAQLRDEEQLWMRPARVGLPSAVSPIVGMTIPYQAWSDKDKVSGTNSGVGGRSLGRAKAALKRCEEWFEGDIGSKEWPFQRIKTLGFGGMGLAIRYQYHSTIGGVAPRDFVIKIGIEGWESKAIRKEETNAKRMARAAHCVQIINPEELGLPSRKPFEFDHPDQLNEDSEEDSGDDDESIPDLNEPLDEGPDRKWMILNRNRDFKDKLENWQQYDQDQKQKIQQRDYIKYLESKRTGDAKGKGKENGLRDYDPAAWDLDRKDFILSEYLENGDLGNFISRLGEAKEMVPNRVLWQFFLCLLKGCLAMEYPVTKFHPRRRERAETIEGLVNRAERLRLDGEEAPNREGKVRGEELFEFVPPESRRWAGERFVHFDIDPQNIFVGGFDNEPGCDGEHDLIPRLKIGDFGLGSKILPGRGDGYYLSYRQSAKRGYYAPEQFGIDWEYVEPINSWAGELDRKPVAGNYGSHTNIWGVGMVVTPEEHARSEKHLTST
ncbi:hypothetical protein GGR53DRAFT_248068 [Hypoxylon sp. FL1150]|nr:hypothetical protein GGR53DRAFT_248068 [Hypoxylon sp. FL1150]